MPQHREISQREYEDQEAWLMSFAAEQRDRRKLRRLMKEYPDEVRDALTETVNK